jgi:hypothetical protein
VAGIIIRVASGIGLLRGREWARRLAVYYAAFAIVYGLYGIGQTVWWLSISTTSLGAWAGSLSFMFHFFFRILILGFNVATVVFLSRRDVRLALARNPGR